MRHLDVLTVYSNCKLKTRQDERQGIKLPLETIAFYSESFLARKISVEQKVTKNWARLRTGPHTESCIHLLPPAYGYGHPFIFRRVGELGIG